MISAKQDKQAMNKKHLTNNASGFLSQLLPNPQPEPTNMNKYENKVVNLTLAAFDGIESSTDVVVYAIVSYMSMAVLRLHSTSVNRMAIEDAVLTALEKKGVEVHH